MNHGLLATDVRLSVVSGQHKLWHRLINTVTCIAIARQRLGKHILVAKNTQETIE
jgi:hypothetical protein